MTAFLLVHAFVIVGAGQFPPVAAAIPRHRVDCPVCAKSFEAFAAIEPNAAAGLDRDLYARAIGPQPEFYRISTCPACLYSGYLADFTEAGPVPPDVVDKVRKSPRLPRPAGITPESDPREIDARDRYSLAIQCYRWQQRSDEAVAWLHLRASWVVRDTACAIPRTPRLERVFAYAQRWQPPRRSGTNQADIEMQMATQAAAAVAEGRFNRFQEPFVRFFVAISLRKQGENRQAGPLLTALRQDPLLEEPLREAAGRMADSIAAESRHQREALACFERALLSEQIAAKNRPVACYLAGELSRRLGRDRDAVRWFDAAIRSGRLPRNLHEWAHEQRALLRVGTEATSSAPGR